MAIIINIDEEFTAMKTLEKKSDKAEFEQLHQIYFNFSKK